MHPELDDPFRCAGELVSSCPLGEQADAIVIDFHAEATSEKQAMGHHLDGRVSVVVGTHTHVPTADHQILAGGTAYQSDAGMCGDYDSSLGMEKEEPLNRFVTKVPRGRFEAASGPATICGLAVARALPRRSRPCASDRGSPRRLPISGDRSGKKSHPAHLATTNGARRAPAPAL